MKALLGAIFFALLLGPWDRAAKLAENGDLTGAEREYRVLLSEAPANPELQYNLGTVLLMQRRYDEARAQLEQAAAQLPANGVTAYNIGNTDLEPAYADSALADRDDRLRRAIASYRRSLIQNPDDVDAKWNLELAQRLLNRETPPPTGGGGGGGGGGAGGETERREGEQPPVPQRASQSGPQPEMSPAEAEDLLEGAQDREGEVQQNTLRKPQPPGPIRP